MDEKEKEEEEEFYDALSDLQSATSSPTHPAQPQASLQPLSLNGSFFHYTDNRLDEDMMGMGTILSPIQEQMESTGIKNDQRSEQLSASGEPRFLRQKTPIAIDTTPATEQAPFPLPVKSNEAPKSLDKHRKSNEESRDPISSEASTTSLESSGTGSENRPLPAAIRLKPLTTTQAFKAEDAPSIVVEPSSPVAPVADFEVMVKNLDNGDIISAEKLYEDYRMKGGVVNPLAYQIYKRSAQAGADENLTDSRMSLAEDDPIKKREGRTKSFFKNMKKKILNDTTSGNASESGEDSGNDDGGEVSANASHYLRVRLKRKPKRQFGRLLLVQELMGSAPSPHAVNNAASGVQNTVRSITQIIQQQTTAQQNPSSDGEGAVWIMRFNRDGRFLAAGGQDAILRVWTLVSEPDAPAAAAATLSEANGNESEASPSPSATNRKLPFIFKKHPYRLYRGHKSDILDLSWSKNDFLLSSSMDKTVRLWHISRKECLCCFQHSDFVTSIVFHPKDDRFFLSGCLDCRLRLWNIPEKKVQFWNEMPESALITAVGFTSDGKMALAGSYLGNCVFFETNGLKYNTQIHVRSSRGKNSKGEKITGIEAMPGQAPGEEKILITSNDSRLRIYQLRDKALFCKYKGLSNSSSQIKAMFSDDGHFIVSGSEDCGVYIWNTTLDSMDVGKAVTINDEGVNEADRKKSENGEQGHFLSALSGLKGLSYNRRDRNSAFECFVAHSSTVTCALFAPKQTSIHLESSGLRNLHGDALSLQGSNQSLNKDDPATDGLKPNDPLSRQRSVSADAPGENTSNTLSILGHSEDQRARSKSAGQSSTKKPASIMSSKQPTSILADGRIIVTADYKGCIRVFENERALRGYYAPVQKQPQVSSEMGSAEQLAGAVNKISTNLTASPIQQSPIQVSYGISTSNAAKATYTTSLK